jgi:hypothetical protein
MVTGPRPVSRRSAAVAIPGTQPATVLQSSCTKLMSRNMPSESGHQQQRGQDTDQHLGPQR